MSSNASSQTESIQFSDPLNQGRIEGNSSIKRFSTAPRPSKAMTESFLSEKESYDFRFSISSLIKEVQKQPNLNTPIGNRRKNKVNLTQTLTIKGKKGKLYEQICPVCLSEFENPLGSLNCEHKFCFSCIQSWAKNSTVCPCCRKTFSIIFKQNEFKQKEEIYVEQKRFVHNEADYFVCYVCGSGDNENVLLICDSCDFNCCHIYCDPELNNTIPEGDWFCRNCFEQNDLQTISISISESQRQEGLENGENFQQDKPIAQRTRSRNIESPAVVFRRLRRRR